MEVRLNEPASDSNKSQISSSKYLHENTRYFSPEMTTPNIVKKLAEAAVKETEAASNEAVLKDTQIKPILEQKRITKITTETNIHPQHTQSTAGNNNKSMNHSPIQVTSTHRLQSPHEMMSSPEFSIQCVPLCL